MFALLTPKRMNLAHRRNQPIASVKAHREPRGKSQSQSELTDGSRLIFFSPTWGHKRQKSHLSLLGRGGWVQSGGLDISARGGPHTSRALINSSLDEFPAER